MLSFPDKFLNLNKTLINPHQKHQYKRRCSLTWFIARRSYPYLEGVRRGRVFKSRHRHPFL